jgi:hypothetical protein
MKYRKLRIVWSVVWGIICLLVVALWVRSYWKNDQIVHRVSATEYVALTAMRGQIAIGGSNDQMYVSRFQRDYWINLGFSIQAWDTKKGSPFVVFNASEPYGFVNFPYYRSPAWVGSPGSTSYELSIPYWLLVLTLSSFSAIPWLKWRFSLRTLLIAMTLVAVGLGLAVYALRN